MITSTTRIPRSELAIIADPSVMLAEVQVDEADIGTVGIVFGILPAAKAAQLDPIESLPYEKVWLCCSWARRCNSDLQHAGFRVQRTTESQGRTLVNTHHWNPERA